MKCHKRKKMESNMKIERLREREERWEDSFKVRFVGDFKRKRYSYSPYDVINVYDYRSKACHRN